MVWRGGAPAVKRDDITILYSMGYTWMPCSWKCDPTRLARTGIEVQILASTSEALPLFLCCVVTDVYWIWNSNHLGEGGITLSWQKGAGRKRGEGSGPQISHFWSRSVFLSLGCSLKIIRRPSKPETGGGKRDWPVLKVTHAILLCVQIQKL